MKKYISVVIFFVIVLIAWQVVYQLGLFNKAAFPSLGDIGAALGKGIANGTLLTSAGFTVTIILEGLALGAVLAFVFCALAITFKPVYTIYNTLIATFDTLPGIALMPLMLVWFPSITMVVIVLMIHGVIWPMSRNILDGYKSTPQIYQEFGENIGLSKWGLVLGIYLPSSMPNIISGLKTGWARAWRALISAEMIFGTIGGGLHGIGWLIFSERLKIDIAGIIAAIIVILVIGIIMEYGVFAQIEKRTVKKWGMVR